MSPFDLHKSVSTILSDLPCVFPSFVCAGSVGVVDITGSTTVVDIYRNFTELHMALGPYFLTTGSNAFAKANQSAMTFTGPDT